MKRNLLTWSVSLILSVIHFAGGELPSSLPKCSRNRATFRDCLYSTLQVARPHIISGDFGNGIVVPPLDPFFIPQFYINFGGVEIAVSNISVRGASEHKVEKLRANADTLKFDLLLTIPKIDVTGKYKVAFNLLGQQIDSDGDIYVTVAQPKTLINLRAQPYAREGKTFIKFDPVGIRMLSGDITDIYLSNLFGGNKLLSDIIVRNFLVTSDFLKSKLFPEFEKIFSKTATEMANRVVESTPLDDIFAS